MAANILIIEDDTAIAEIVSYNLRQAGYKVQIVGDGRLGLETAIQQQPDLIILDLMLPSLDGIEICRRLRADERTSQTLVLMLTARSEESDQVVGFAVNADDYVTKPFSVKVLLERVRALLRRRESSATDQNADQNAVIRQQGIEIDRARHTARAEGRDLDLTPTEFSLLETFLRQPGRAFTRNDLIDSAMGADTIVLERTIDVHIRSLRKKLAERAELIETVRGIGYRLRESESSQECDSAVHD